MLMALALPMMVACGGDDNEDEPKQMYEAITEEEGNIRMACRLFGLNRDDYDTFNGRGFDGINIIAFHNKKNNSLFVGVYEENTNKILFTNSNIKVNLTERIQYYENVYECSMSYYGFDFVKKEGGFFLAVNVWYANGDNNVRCCMPFVYIFNGQAAHVIGVNNAVTTPAQLYDWYNDACIVALNGEFECYTINGEGKFLSKDNNITQYTNKEKNYFLSYEDCISVNYDTYMHKMSLSRVKFASSDINTREISLFTDMPQDTRVSFSFERADNIVTINVKAVSMNGNTESAVVQYNIETDEYVVK